MRTLFWMAVSIDSTKMHRELDKDGDWFVRRRHYLETKHCTSTDQLTDNANTGQSNGKPSPMPIPSNREGNTGFLEA